MPAAKKTAAKTSGLVEILLVHWPDYNNHKSLKVRNSRIIKVLAKYQKLDTIHVKSNNGNST